MREPRALVTTEVQDGDWHPVSSRDLAAAHREEGTGQGPVPGVGGAEEVPPEMQPVDGTWPLPPPGSPPAHTTLLVTLTDLPHGSPHSLLWKCFMSLRLQPWGSG